MQPEPSRKAPLNIRVGGRLAFELVRIADRESNTVSSVAKRLIAEALQHQEQSRAA